MPTQTVTLTVPAHESRIFPIVWLGDQDIDLHVNAILDHPGSSLKILGLFFGAKHHLELHTNVVHRAPDTFSRTIIRGVLDGTASTHYEGNVLIEKDAKNADGDLKGHAILLSKTSRAVLIPQLKVLENQVKASHGATVGKIDEEQIFYLMSRGLSLEQAKLIIIQGFLGSLLSEFPKKEATEVARIIGL